MQVYARLCKFLQTNKPQGASKLQGASNSDGPVSGLWSRTVDRPTLILTGPKTGPSLVMGSDDLVSGLRPETDRPTPILKGPKPTEDWIITDRAITSKKAKNKMIFFLF